MNDTPATLGTTSRVELMRRDIPGAGNREAVMFLLSLPPGAAAPTHRHPGIGVGYDLAQTPHLIARNGSHSEPLRFIMTFIVQKGGPTILPL
jgi:hypothetical protein